MKSRLQIVLFTLLFVPAALATAADTAHGMTLAQQHCTACHDNGVYTRENRRITTLDGLRTQVRRCELSLGLKWFDEDIDDVTVYLNESFYKF
ncbi:MAG: cytochrome c [Halobacteria archaeon]|nr:cytochrome c [Halobacteria archaeon]